MAEKKDWYQYEMMEPTDYDVDAKLSDTRCPAWLVAETPDYEFFCVDGCSDRSGGYVIRRSKQMPSEKVFFGKSFPFSCVFENYLFQSKSNGEYGVFYVLAKNVETGEEKQFDWIGGKYFTWVTVFGRWGRLRSMNSINQMAVKEDRLVFNFTHRCDPMSKEEPFTKHTLEVRYIDGEFVPGEITPPLPICKKPES